MTSAQTTRILRLPQADSRHPENPATQARQ